VAKRTLVRRADNAARISYDDSTSELFFERYNTETAAWEESLKINLSENLTTLSKIVNLEVYRDDYGGNFTNFTPPDPEKGRFFFAEDTNAANPAKRLYVCLDGSTWSYVNLT